MPNATISRWRDSADSWYVYMILFYAFIAYSGGLFFEVFGLRPNDPGAYASVSPFYGPGGYLAWWLMATSVVMKGPVECAAGNAHWENGADLLSTLYYVAAATICSIIRIFHRHDAELEAGLTVLEAGADFGLIHVFVTTTKASTRGSSMLLAVFGVMIHQASPIPELQVAGLSKSVPSAASAVVKSAPSTAGTVAATLTSSTELNSSSSSAISAIASRAFASRDFKLAAVLNLFLVALLTLVWTLGFPLKQPKWRRLLVVFLLLILWLSSNDFGTYAIMPRTEVELIGLDQLASLGGAILVVGWSWKAELKTGGKLIKRHLDRLRQKIASKMS